MNKNNKAFVYAIIFLILAVSIGTALKPVYLDWYFTQENPISIEEAISIRDSMDSYINKSFITKNNTVQYGKVFLVNGIADIWDDGSFMITDTCSHQDYNLGVGRNLVVEKTDRINCIPIPGQSITVAGAFNPGRNRSIDFYGVWIVGGCRE